MPVRFPPGLISETHDIDRQSLHLYGGRIWTGRSDERDATRILIRDGRVATLEESADRRVHSIDVGGCWVVPGLIDAHLHLVEGGERLEHVNLANLPSRQAFESVIAERHAELAPDAWLVGSGWAEASWGGDAPDKSWLRAAGDRPCVCYRMDLHAAVVNEAVMERIDWSRIPEGGRIVRDEHGAPTGLLAESALWDGVNPILPETTTTARRRALRNAARHAVRHGLTTVGSMEYLDVVRAAYVPEADELPLRVRLTLLDRRGALPFEKADALRTIGTCGRAGVIGFKAFLDGTLGSRTARFLAPYADAPDDWGTFVEHAVDGTLPTWACDVAARGWQPAIHAVGDAAVRCALDALETIDREIAARVRPRIEHAQHVDRADRARFAGRVASMQPLHRAFDAGTVATRLGTDRLDGFFAYRALAEHGARFAFGSDWPVVSLDPLAGIRAAVTGLDADDRLFRPDEVVDVPTAMRAYTRDAAFALHLDDAGVLRPGALGDCTVLDRDPFTADWVDAPPRVVMTIVAGEVVHAC